ncbi:DUF3152 domain-containing protein [Terrabacter sp. MAHUQ-38]|uniref:DUF3152 domain-containing protein n=1 Tax=unclassified Terrabacter TaxID=2630222 RepID=UPI00165D6FB7|nr:DUF3152 domain-containing protein [Terrabacter sp. MAHUQ-38]MBC9823754.1 DUF3152 domain-containing protein [Terrabacter sp. MAHUQ-38]
MARGSAVRPPTRSQRQAIRRRRTWAGLAVVLCVAADVWSVSWAGAEQPLADGSVVRASRVALAAGIAPAVSVDQVERVPETSTDTQGGGGSADGTTRAADADTAGDGRDAAGAVIEKGSGTFTVVAMPAAALKPSPATGRVVRYTVELEGGLDVRAADLATKVGSVLTDARGWQTKDGVRFVDVAPADATAGAQVDLHITLASPTTTDKLCAPLQTRGQVSCHNTGRVVLNLRRWVLGAAAYGTDVDSYRTYLVNHEVGHGIGHAHAYCGGAGRPAPVMMQQTYGLKGCTAWPWPTAKPA